MPRKHSTHEQIAFVLRQAENGAQGLRGVMGVSEPTFYHWIVSSSAWACRRKSMITPTMSQYKM